MLYLYSGTDLNKSREKARKLADSLTDRQPDAPFLRILADEFDSMNLEDLIVGQGLFSSKALVFMDQLSLNKDAFSFCLEWLDKISESPNIFVMLEGALDSKTQKKLSKVAEKHTISNSKEADILKNDYNVFNLTDAIGRRDKKTSWLLLQEALREGLVPEEIHGAVSWFARSMCSTLSSQKAVEAGVKPFVFNKAKKSAGNFSKEELIKMSEELAVMVQKDREGGLNLSVQLEKFILSL